MSMDSKSGSKAAAFHRRAQKAEGRVKKLEEQMRAVNEAWRQREKLWLNEARTFDAQRDAWDGERTRLKSIIRDANDLSQKAIKDSLQTRERLLSALSLNHAECALWFFIGGFLGAGLTAMLGSLL